MYPIAILIFARSASIESNTKKIAVNGARNLLLFAKLDRKIKAIAAKCDIPYFICDETCQTGNTFGEKISSAIATIFNGGFEKVLVVGSDCPDLSPAKLKNAVTELTTNKLVVGPDHSGGTYLMGIDKSIFNIASFSGLPWQTPGLCAAIGSLHAHKLLGKLYDMNDVKSAKQLFLTLTFASPIKKILAKIMVSTRLTLSGEVSLFYKNFVYRNFSLRAPPALAL